MFNLEVCSSLLPHVTYNNQGTRRAHRDLTAEHFFCTLVVYPTETMGSYAPLIESCPNYTSYRLLRRVDAHRTNAICQF